MVIGQSLVGIIAERRAGARTPQQAIPDAKDSATALKQLLDEGKA